MSLRRIARQAALTIPRLRRFYEYTQGLRAERDRLAGACAELRRERDAAVAARDAAQRAAAAAEEQRERLDLELYVLRSDFQRAVAASEKIRARLVRCEQALEALRAEKSDPARATPTEPSS